MCRYGLDTITHALKFFIKRGWLQISICGSDYRFKVRFLGPKQFGERVSMKHNYMIFCLLVILKLYLCCTLWKRPLKTGDLRDSLARRGLSTFCIARNFTSKDDFRSWKVLENQVSHYLFISASAKITFRSLICSPLFENSVWSCLFCQSHFHFRISQSADISACTTAAFQDNNKLLTRFLLFIFKNILISAC